MIPAIKKFNIVRLLLSKSIFDDNVIHCILTYYWKLLDNKRKVLLPWITINKLYWNKLSRNPNAIDILKVNEDKIDWSNLSKNPNAIKLLEANKDKIQWISIYKNPSIFQYKTVLPIY